MDIFNKDNYSELAGHNSDICISIYIPTHRYGKEVNEGVDRIQFKTRIQEVEKKLEAKDTDAREIDSLVKPAWGLYEDLQFWRHQSDGLAVFIAKDFSEYFTVPLSLEAAEHISDRFYLKPMLPLLTGDGRFYLLSFSKESTRLYEGTRHSITEIYINDVIPEGMKEALRFDDPEQSLQQRRGKNEQEGLFHGQGGGEDVEKTDIWRYLTEVDNGVMKLIACEEAPLIIASLEFLQPIYRKANNYHNLLPEGVNGNHENMDLGQLHREAWEKVKPEFDKQRQESLERFSNGLKSALTSSIIDDVVSGSMYGKTDTLFIKKGATVNGTFDKEKNIVNQNSNGAESGSCLLDMAAHKTLENGGRVYIMEPHEMPVKDAEAAALFRYE